jgi:cytoskeletal protein RodZ
MSNDGDYVERTTTTEGPATVRREEVRTAGPAPQRSAAGWWIAAIVAVIAIVGLIFMFNNQDQLQAAKDQGAAEATLNNATATAQAAAANASQAAQTAVDSTTRASQQAAAAASNAANQTAQAARTTADAAQDAATTEPPPK